jgi:hypothetical protein
VFDIVAGLSALRLVHWERCSVRDGGHNAVVASGSGIEDCQCAIFHHCCHGRCLCDELVSRVGFKIGEFVKMDRRETEIEKRCKLATRSEQCRN